MRKPFILILCACFLCGQPIKNTVVFADEFDTGNTGMTDDPFAFQEMGQDGSQTQDFGANSMDPVMNDSVSVLPTASEPVFELSGFDQSLQSTASLGSVATNMAEQGAGLDAIGSAFTDSYANLKDAFNAQSQSFSEAYDIQSDVDLSFATANDPDQGPVDLFQTSQYETIGEEALSQSGQDPFDIPKEEALISDIKDTTEHLDLNELNLPDSINAYTQPAVELVDFSDQFVDSIETASQNEQGYANDVALPNLQSEQEQIAVPDANDPFYQGLNDTSDDFTYDPSLINNQMMTGR